ncbi:HipA family kinase [Niallia nealsonii]|uniref:HipA-like kinase domain-containing protein n=1 Tax=Niallia nealsonii TaxID=115979 RepID=A0A2N0YW99_9BACI|nr:HipA family kinase [Niallia nealsonii]PKG21528.1 hypothetical protein CWS01_22015 [Niallia nealsonii]
MTIYATEYLGAVDEGEMYAQLFRCSDGNTYVVKAMSNPIGRRAIFNELVSYRLGRLLNLPLSYGRIIVFSKSIFNDPHLLDEKGIQEGPHFGSLFIKNASEYSPDKLYFCKNIHMLPEIIVFDHWITNYDRRLEPQNILVVGKNPYELVLIDHADAFNGPDWTIESLVSWTDSKDIIWGEIYQEFVPFIDNEDPFGLALEKLESITDEEIAAAFGKDIPSEWQVSKEEVKTLLFHLIMRKKRVRKIITHLKSYFPIWNSSSE